MKELSLSGHTHSNYALKSHTHSGYASSSHTHSASQITSGTLSVSRGGTGVTSLSALASSLQPYLDGGSSSSIGFGTRTFSSGSGSTLSFSVGSATFMLFFSAPTSGTNGYGYTIASIFKNTGYDNKGIIIQYSGGSPEIDATRKAEVTWSGSTVTLDYQYFVEVSGETFSIAWIYF